MEIGNSCNKPNHDYHNHHHRNNHKGYHDFFNRNMHQKCYPNRNYEYKNDYPNIYDDPLADLPSLDGSLSGSNYYNKRYDAPIGMANMDNMDQQVIQAAIQEAGVPDSLLPVAIEHLNAMNENGTSNRDSSTLNTDPNSTANPSQEKATKLAEFLRDYYNMFGDNGNISREEYLSNVSEMMREDMAAKGKRFVSPFSPQFDQRSLDYGCAPDSYYGLDYRG